MTTQTPPPITQPGRPTRPALLRVASTVAFAVVVATLSACSTAAHGAAGTTSHPSSHSTTSTSSVTPTTVGVAGYVTIDGKKVAVPDERGNQPVRPGNDVGEQVLITSKAIEPRQLFCEVGFELTFTNLTTSPQRLHFVNDGGWYSPTIAPGGTWHYTPKYGLEYQFVSSSGRTADFQASLPIPGNP